MHFLQKLHSALRMPYYAVCECSDNVWAILKHLDYVIYAAGRNVCEVKNVIEWSTSKSRLYFHVTHTNVPLFDPSPKFAIRSKAVHS